LQPWNSNRPSTNISNLASRDRSTHEGETEQTNLPLWWRAGIRSIFGNTCACKLSWMTRTHTTVIAHFNIDMLSMSFIFARLSLCATFSIREAFWKDRNLYSRVLFCAQSFIIARYSEKLAMSIRARFFERSVFYSRDNLKRSWFLFASLPLCAAFSIREPFWKTRHLYSRAFLWAQYFLFARQSEKVEIVYSRLFLCAQRFLFASHSEKLAIFIRAPFFERSVFYSRDNLERSRFFFRVSSFVRSVFYLRVMLKSRNLYSREFFWAQRFLFARQSEHSRSLFARWGVCKFNNEFFDIHNSTVLSGCNFPLCLLWVFEYIGHVTPNNYFHVRLRFILRSAKNVAAPLCIPAYLHNSPHIPF